MDKTTKENVVFITKKENVATTIFPSQTTSGAMISTAWKVSKNRCNPGERVYFTHSWSEDSFIQGTITNKYKQGDRFNIEFMPDEQVLKYDDYKHLSHGQEKAYWSNSELYPSIKKEYRYRVQTVNGFKMLSSHEAEQLKLVDCEDKIGQNGIRYPRPNTLVCSSDTAKDIIDAMEKGYWDHGSRPAQAQPGDDFYVIVNQKVSKQLGSYIAIRAQLSRVDTLEYLDNTWTSSDELEKVA